MVKNNIKNACLVVIGNEILTGRTQDKNINHIARELFKVGILLNYVCVIPDIQKTIVKEIRRLKKDFDYVITTGGIGPTHDDITAESISIAVSREYKLHQGAYRDLSKYYKKIKSELTDARKKMAYMPSGSKLIKNKISGAPGFNIENIYVFAGIPSIVEAMMKEFIKNIKPKNFFYTTSIIVKLPESKIANFLFEAEKNFKYLTIGSYPIYKSAFKQVEIVLTTCISKKYLNTAKKYISSTVSKIK